MRCPPDAADDRCQRHQTHDHHAEHAASIRLFLVEVIVGIEPGQPLVVIIEIELTRFRRIFGEIIVAIIVGCGSERFDIAADTDAEATRLFTSLQMRFADMARGVRGYMKPPIDDIEDYWSGPEKMQAQRMLACSFAGSPNMLRKGLTAFIAKTGADELMVATAVYDHGARLKSYELLAGV